MTASMNVAVLVGRLTKDVNLKSTPNGTMVATFTLAVDRTTKDQNGNHQADFIPCVVWNSKYSKAAENLATYAHKGSLIGVNGKIQTRNYEDKSGNRVYVTEVRVGQFNLLESRRAADDYLQGQYSAQEGGYSYHQGNQPQGQPQVPQAPQQSPGSSDYFDGQGAIEVSNDDLPF